MEKGLCVYPGSFDPVHYGHIDLIKRASMIFPRVIVAVLYNPSKIGLFNIDSRMAMLLEVCRSLDNVDVDCFDGLLVDYLQKMDAGVILRGLRNTIDFEKEFQMAKVNRQIGFGVESIETLFLAASPQYAHISSSVIKEVARLGGGFAAFVPPLVERAIVRRIEHERNLGISGS